MRDTFVRTLIDLAKKNKNIELITGDLGFGVLKPFWEELPDQFTNIGHSGTEHDDCSSGNGLGGKDGIYLFYWVTFLRYAVWNRSGMTVLTTMPMLRLYV